MKRTIQAALVALLAAGMVPLIAATATAVVVEEPEAAAVKDVEVAPAPVAMPEEPPSKAPAKEKAPRVSEKARLAQLAEALSAIEAAKKALADNDTQAATMQLDKAAALVASVHKAMEAAAKPAKIANKLCPVDGHAVDPKAPTREFGEKIVGFCCAACPEKWDQMTDDEKEAKLKEAMKKKVE